jgi:hypothetical protein
MGNCNAKSVNYGASSHAKEFDHTVEGIPIHNGYVLGASYISEDKLLTSGEDNKVSILALDKLKADTLYNPRVLLGHSKAVNRVLYDEAMGVVWSGSRDLSVKMVISVLFYLSSKLFLFC